MVDQSSLLEEYLREASCNGDIANVVELVVNGANVNSHNSVNGWTALHWAVARNHKDVVEYLLENGADPFKANFKGETPVNLICSVEVQNLFGKSEEKIHLSALPIVPSYLKYRISSAKKIQKEFKMPFNTVINYNNGTDFADKNCTNELVLKVRIANCGDPDFIEIEIPKGELTFAQLIKICCEELHTQPNQIVKVRKLPNTILRKDKDVHRLTDYQEIEIVLSTPTANANNNVLLTSILTSATNGNGYESIGLRKNQTVLY